MSIHIQKFVDRVRGQEARGARELIMSIQDAKDLHADITKLLAQLQMAQQARVSSDPIAPNVNVEISGGTFK